MVKTMGLTHRLPLKLFHEERAEERICLVRRLYDREMNSAQISELIGLDKEQAEEMLQTKSNFENNG